MWFGITNTPATFPTSTGRTFTSHRTRVNLRLWVDGRRLPAPVVSLWDTAADFIVVSEWAARLLRIPFDRATEALTTSGTAGTSSGVLLRLGFQLDQVDVLRGVGFVADWIVLRDTTFPLILLGNLFVRRNFNIQTVGERRTFFRLREHAPDAVPASRLSVA